MRPRTRTMQSHLKRCTAGRCFGALPVRDALHGDSAEPKLSQSAFQALPRDICLLAALPRMWLDCWVSLENVCMGKEMQE
jgi:hypothetical protein